jgi:hypothetical protein
MRWVCHSWYLSKIRVEHTKTYKNHNNIVCEECLAHTRTLLVS